MRRWRTYTAYSIGCAIVWLVILALVIGLDPAHTQRIFWLVSGGWWIGWLSATIARAVYPPTKAQQAPSIDDPTTGHGLRSWWRSPPRRGMRRLINPYEYRHLRVFGSARIVGGTLGVAASVICLSYGVYG